MAGSVPLTGSVCQQSWSIAYCCVQLAVSSQLWSSLWPVLISSTRGGMARLSWPGWLIINTKMVQTRLEPATVTHPSTNRGRCRVNALIETNTLPLCQTTTTIITMVLPATDIALGQLQFISQYVLYATDAYCTCRLGNNVTRPKGHVTLKLDTEALASSADTRRLGVSRGDWDIKVCIVMIAVVKIIFLTFVKWQRVNVINKRFTTSNSTHKFSPTSLPCAYYRRWRCTYWRRPGDITINSSGWIDLQSLAENWSERKT